MRFYTLVIHNVLRRKLRSALTAAAVAIAVGSVVSLVGIANGFKDSFMDFYQAADVDMVVTRSGSQRRLTSTLDESLSDKIAAIDGVREVVPGLADVVSFSEANLFVVPVSGLIPETHVFEHFRLTDGRLLLKSDVKTVMLGVDLADTLNKPVGSILEVVESEPFTVVGIFESSNVFENGSIVMPIGDLQVLMGREGQISGVSISVDEPGNEEAMDRITQQVMAMETGLSVRTTREHVESLTEIQMAIAVAWLTSTVAILIGTLGTLNTMFMSIQERIREIGILRALGWERRRIVWMILGESVMISCIGGVVGAIAAIVLVRLLTQVPAVNGLIQGRLDWIVLAQGIGVALLVGFFGGLLPAISASRLTPAQALQN
jgi:putative ABC transport system permease protein